MDEQIQRFISSIAEYLKNQADEQRKQSDNLRLQANMLCELAFFDYESASNISLNDLFDVYKKNTSEIQRIRDDGNEPYTPFDAKSFEKIPYADGHYTPFGAKSFEKTPRADDPNEDCIPFNVKGVSVDKKPRADGRWQARYISDGKQKSIYGKSRAEVIDKITKILNGETPKERKKIEKLTLYAWLDEHYNCFRLPVLKSPVSQRNICRSVKRLKSLFPNKPLDKFDTIEIQTKLTSVDATAERRALFAELNAAFEKALKLRKTKYNPCEAVVIAAHQGERRAALTLAEQKRFLSAVRAQQNQGLSILLRFLLATGTRIEETLAVAKSKLIPFGNSYAVKINASLVRIQKKDILKKGSKTLSGTRVVPISDMLYDKLMNYAKNKKVNEPIFSMGYDMIYKAIKRLYARSGISYGALHTLRHTYSTRLEENGVPEIIRGFLLGHKGQNITNNTYTDVQAEYLERYIPTIHKYINELFDTNFDT
jgi:integrase